MVKIMHTVITVNGDKVGHALMQPEAAMEWALHMAKISDQQIVMLHPEVVRFWEKD